MQQIRRLIGHQKLRAIRRAQNQRPRRAQPRHHRRILTRYFPIVQQAPDLAFQSSRRNRRLHRDRQSEQRSAPALSPKRVMLPRPRPNPIRIEVGKRIQLRIQPLDLVDMRLSDFQHRNLARAQKLKLPHRRLEHQFVHRSP